MEESIDILFVGYSLAVGGAEKKLLETAEYFVRKGKQIKILLIKDVIELPVPKILQNEILIYDDGFSLKSLKTIRKTIQTYNPQVIFGFLGHINVMLGMLKYKFPNTLFVGRENATYSVYFEEKDKISSLILKKLYKKYLNQLDRIIFQSNYAKEEAIDLFSISDKKTYVLNNPLPQVKTRKTRSRSNDTIRLLSVGRLEKVKNQKDMIKVLSLLPSNYELIFVGDGSQLDALKELSKKLGVHDRVKFEGYQSNVEDYYLNSDLLLLTSYRETYPNVVLEATAHGLYTVSYSMPGGIYDIIIPRLNGELVEMFDIQGLRDHIINSPGQVCIPNHFKSLNEYYKNLSQLLEK